MLGSLAAVGRAAERTPNPQPQPAFSLLSTSTPVDVDTRSFGQASATSYKIRLEISILTFRDQATGSVPTMQTPTGVNSLNGSAMVGELTPGRLGENTGALPTGVSSGGSSGTTTGITSGLHNTHIGQNTHSGMGNQTGLTSGIHSGMGNQSGLTSGTHFGMGNQSGLTSGTHSGMGNHSGLTSGTHSGMGTQSGLTSGTHSGTHSAVPAGAAAGTGAGLASAHPHSGTHSNTHSGTNSGTNGTGSNMGPGIPAGTPATATTALATGANMNGHNPATGVTRTGGPEGAKDFSRASGISGQEVCGNHTVPGMEHIGTGYSGPHTKRGDISAPTGALPAGFVEKGATNQPIPRPSPKDFFKMSNSGTPAAPQALAQRPVHQDPISESDHVAPDHGGHMGLPGDMKTATPSQRTEGVNPYAAGAHGDHLVQGLSHGGTGYAGATAARGDNTAPTGSLPPGTIEAGAQNQAIPRPSAKDQFLINNAATPSNPISLAKRAFKSGLGIGKAPTDETTTK
ncbi:hypothetical protein WJX74_010452 [Apatococcus lobatus]|uniref:Uncharacterized protein n=1 Tax=Apatococcus lobatus TaxID=904363 RepID=A0AAW1Q555_9CHLO